MYDLMIFYFWVKIIFTENIQNTLVRKMNKDIYSFNSNIEPKKNMKLKIKIHLQKKKRIFPNNFISSVFTMCMLVSVCTRLPLS